MSNELKKIDNMNERAYKLYVKMSLEDQMRSLQRGNIHCFCRASNALRCFDKKYGTLLQPRVVPVSYGLYGLFVLQNKKNN